MNDKIISELRKELDLLEYGTDPDKHIYAMQRLLAVIENDEEGHKGVQKTLVKEESTPWEIYKNQIEQVDVGKIYLTSRRKTMLAFLTIGILAYLFTFILKPYKERISEKYEKTWSKNVNYIRWISLAIVLSGLIYTEGASLLLVSGWLLVFSLIIYMTSLGMIYYKNRKAI